MNDLIATQSAKVIIELVSTDSARLIASQVVKSIEDSRVFNIYQIIESVGMGVGTMLIGIGALYTILPWVDKKRRKYKIGLRISDYKKSFPDKLIGAEIQIVTANNDKGTWYLTDDRTKSRHWIENMETVRAMGWQRHKKPIPQSTLIVYRDEYSLNIYSELD